MRFQLHVSVNTERPWHEQNVVRRRWFILETYVRPASILLPWYIPGRVNPTYDITRISILATLSLHLYYEYYDVHAYNTYFRCAQHSRTTTCIRVKYTRYKVEYIGEQNARLASGGSP